MCSRCLAIMRGLTSGARDGDAGAARADELEDLHLAVGELGEVGGTGRAEGVAGRMAASSGSRTDIEQVAVSLAEIDAGAVDGDADDLLVRTRQADGHLVLDG